MSPRRPPLLTVIAALLFTLAIGLVGPQASALASPQAECPSDTTRVAKYDVEGQRNLTLTEGTDVIDFSDLYPATGELKRVDFTSSVPIAYVYVKAGNDPEESRAYDYRTSPVTQGNDLQAGGENPKGISHITFCGPQTGTLRVVKYNDIDGNGTRATDEPGLEGWVFDVLSGSTVVGSITTDASGNGSLILAGGTYRVNEHLPLASGWTNTQPGGATPGYDVAVVAGQETTPATFGNHQTLALLLTSMCSVDPAVSREWRVRNPNAFDVPFTWEVYGTSQTGSGTALASSDVFFSTVTVSGPNTTKVYWSGGETVKASGGATCAPTTGSLSVTKYNDLDNDGQRDENEGVLSGWTFTAKNAAGETVGTMTTDASGTATLANLVPGTYSLVETAKAGWTNSDPGGGTETGLAVSAGQTATATFGNHQTLALLLTSMCSVDPAVSREWRVRNPNAFDVPFTWEVYGTSQTGSGTALASSDVFFSTVTVSGPNTTKVYWSGGETVKASGGATCAPTTGSLRVFKYNDLDGNGEQGGAGESGLSQWSFTVAPVFEATSLQLQSFDLVTGSDVLGFSEYLSLAPGTYRVCENTPLPANWTNTDPGDGYCKTIDLEAGASVTVSFGNHYTYTPPTPHGTLNVTKYHDSDRDGTRDPGEPGLSGWTFEVRSGGFTFTTMTTGSDGTAALTLGAGTYTVVEVAQLGWTSTDPGGVTPTKTVTVADGQVTSIVFGNAQVILPPTSQTQIVIFKYADANANGKRDDGENGLAGFTFLIRNDSGAVVASAETDIFGLATITNLPLGGYSVVEQQRNGWFNTDPGGAAQKFVVLTSTGLIADVSFGNVQVRLPSTSTAGDDGGTLWMLLFVLGLGLTMSIAQRARAPR